MLLQAGPVSPRPCPLTGGQIIRCLAIVFAIFAIGCCLAPSGRSATIFPTSHEALVWRPPARWIYQAWCIHRYESVDWHRRWVDWRGAPSRYAGGMQFTLSTWRRAGGRGEPWQWKPREQIYRAWRIWRSYRNEWRPGSWVEWGSRFKCGLD